MIDYIRPAPCAALISHVGLFSIMDFELYPSITLRDRSFSALVAPSDLFVQALNRNLDLQRFKVLYVTGNYSRVLTGLSRRFTDLEIRRGFTVFQLMTILEQARHSPILIEHDPMLYEDAKEMTEYVSQAMIQASQDAAVLLYATGMDPYFEEIVQDADRAWYFDDAPRVKPRIVSRTNLKVQRTLEAFT